MLPSQPGAPIPDVIDQLEPVDAEPVIQEMIGHLNNFDAAAVQTLEKHRRVFQALLGEKLAAFEQKITGFSFLEALEQLEALGREKGSL